jgi:hypothetical protein
MIHLPQSPLARRLALLVPPALAAALLFVDLGGFGIWEPHESRVLEDALAPDPAAGAVTVASPVTRLLARAAVAILGPGAVAARLPGAILCWFAILLVQLTLTLLHNRRCAAFGTLALASSAVCLFHGRQLTGDAPLLLAQTAATAGLALAAFAPGRRAAALGAVLAVLGLCLGPLEAGLLAGAVLPAGTSLAALFLTGDAARVFSAADRPHPRRVATAAAAGAVTLLAAGAYLTVMLIEMPDSTLVTGGLAAAPVSWPGFDGPFGKLAYGWFPWVVVVPLALLPLFTADRDDGPAPLLAVAIAGIAVGYLVQVVDTTARGPGPLFLCLPLAAAVGLALERLETSRETAALSAVFALVFMAVLIRDFAQTPEIILSAHGFERVAVPGDFKPVIPAALASLPFVAMLALLGFVRERTPAGASPGHGTGGPRPDWRRIRGSLLAPAAAAAFGGWIAFAMVPGLSRDLSPRQAFDSFAALGSGGEPLAILGDNASLPEAERLSSTGELVRWLAREDRVLALMPPAHLATIDRAFRHKRGRHLHVLDRSTDRFLLLTNRPRTGEANQNPLAGFVFEKAFERALSHPLEIGFNGKVTLLGWELGSGAGGDVLERGKSFTLSTAWRCDEELTGDYRIFLHIEGPGPRINGDHTPVREALPTREWRPGDHVLDLFEGFVPPQQVPGRYTIETGLFRGNTRLAVDDDARSRDNAVVLGTVELK